MHPYAKYSKVQFWVKQKNDYISNQFGRKLSLNSQVRIAEKNEKK